MSSRKSDRERRPSARRREADEDEGPAEEDLPNAGQAYDQIPIPRGGECKAGGRKRATPALLVCNSLTGLGRANILRVASMLSPLEALKLAHSSKELLLDTLSETTRESKQFWHEMLYSSEVSLFGCYSEMIPQEVRAKVEEYYGAKRVVGALVSNKCGNCGKFSTSFNVLACQRACIDCWACSDGGERGRNATSPFAICAVHFAKSHFLVTDGDFVKKKIFSLDIVDATKAHGLMSDRMTICLVKEARQVGEARYGGPEGVAAEQQVRYAASRAKGRKTPAQMAEQWNFLCRNQRSRDMMMVASSYGLYADIMVPNMLTAPPTIFLTRASEEQITARFSNATAEAFANRSCTIFSNIVEAFVHARGRSGCTVVIDMAVSIGAHFRDCDKEICAVPLALRDSLTVADKKQDSTVIIHNDCKIVGTAQGRISSSTACFWVGEKVLCEIEGLNMTTSTHGDDFSPCLVNNGLCKLTRCHVTSDGGGYSALLHGRFNSLYDCDVSSSAGCGAFHVKVDKFPEALSIKGCRIEHAADSDWAFHDADPPGLREFNLKAYSDNEITEVEYDGYNEYEGCG